MRTRGPGRERRRLGAPTAAVVLSLALALAVPGAAAAQPDVTTSGTPTVTPHTALLAGSITPNGGETDGYFAWGDTPALGTTTSPQPAGAGNQPVLVEEPLTGLIPGTTYHYNLIAQQGSFTFAGTPVSFVTPQEPVLTAPQATEIGWNRVTLDGSIDPKDGDTEWAWEYAKQADFSDAQTAGGGIIPGGAPAGPVPTQFLLGLEPGTTYHYRLVALESGLPTWFSPPSTFTTRSPDDPTAIARAMAADPAEVTGASWLERPLVWTTAGVFGGPPTGGPFSGFPLDGSTFAAMTTGAADDLAPDASYHAMSSGGGTSGFPVPSRGPSAQDVNVLRVDLNAPADATCLSVAFRFLTTESPDPQNPYNDAFIAELDASTWTTTDTTLSAPRNFAFGPAGQVVSVNGLSDEPTTQADAAGTPFSWATPVLRASTPITPGLHTLYLSLFDQGDQILDSAVLLDRLRFTATPGAACGAGVVSDSVPLGTVRPGSGTGGAGPTAAGVAGSGATGSPEPLLGTQVVGSATEGRVYVTPPGGRPAQLAGDRPIPLGSRVDARAGRVRITAANDTGDGRLSGEFYGGVFVVTQDRTPPVTTNLRLVEDIGLRACKRSRGARGAAKRKARKRFLWGDGKGRFRTTGKYGAATVRGTKWLVEDSCAGTRVQVARGVVDVRDFVRKKTLSVPAGRSYLARRPR